MRFSILLPTRNRLGLLRYAVQSVLDQDYDDWEIVIADNASEDDVAGYVSELADRRIKYLRSDAVLPVTQNWSRALDNSSGDYVIMLGDDDCLLDRCLSIAAMLLAEYRQPDLLYTEAVQFAYPGVIPAFPQGFVQYGYCRFLNGQTEPFWLTRQAALECVAESLRFKIAYSYNMQHSVVSRKIIERLKTKGPFFQSPYPDYYATNVLLLTAETILVSPWPLVAIGISPKSFGFYYFNQRESEGVAFLQNVGEQDVVERVKAKVLPGSNMNTSWLLAMESVKKNFPETIPVPVDYSHYRFMQFRELQRDPGAHGEFVNTLNRSGSTGERLFWRAVDTLNAIGSRVLPNQLATKIVQRLLGYIHTSHPRFDPRRRTVPYQNILELERGERAHGGIPPNWRTRFGLGS